MQKRALCLFTLLLLIWFGASLLSAKFGGLSYDEAWYLTASHLPRWFAASSNGNLFFDVVEQYLPFTPL